MDKYEKLFDRFFEKLSPLFGDDVRGAAYAAHNAAVAIIVERERQIRVSRALDYRERELPTDD